MKHIEKLAELFPAINFPASVQLGVSYFTDLTSALKSATIEFPYVRGTESYRMNVRDLSAVVSDGEKLTYVGPLAELLRQRIMDLKYPLLSTTVNLSMEILLLDNDTVTPDCRFSVSRASGLKLKQGLIVQLPYASVPAKTPNPTDLGAFLADQGTFFRARASAPSGAVISCPWVHPPDAWSGPGFNRMGQFVENMNRDTF